MPRPSSEGVTIPFGRDRPREPRQLARNKIEIYLVLSTPSNGRNGGRPKRSNRDASNVVISAITPSPVRSTSSLNGTKTSLPARRRYEAAAGIRLAAVG